MDINYAKNIITNQSEDNIAKLNTILNNNLIKYLDCNFIDMNETYKSFSKTNLNIASLTNTLYKIGRTSTMTLAFNTANRNTDEENGFNKSFIIYKDNAILSHKHEKYRDVETPVYLNNEITQHVATIAPESNIIFVHFDVMKIFDNSIYHDLFIDTILAISKELYSDLGIDINNFDNEIEKLKYEKFKKQIIEQIKITEQNRITTIENRLVSQKNRAAQLLRDYLSLERQIPLEMQQLEAIKDLPDKIEEKLIHEFEILKNNKKITKIEVDNEFLTLYTTDLVMTDKHNRQFKIYPMKIEIHIEAGSVRFFKANPSDPDYHAYWTHNDSHPHISGSSGEACLGNAAEMIADYLSKYEFGALAYILIDFLENVNIDDSAGQYATKWDRIIDGKVVKAKDVPSEDCNEEEDEEYITCQVCGEELVVGRDEYYECSECGCILCGDCTHWDNNDDPYCEDCYHLLEEE